MQDPAPMFSQMNGNPQLPEQEHLKCPRCDSANTKFCYYNNYNLSQPRHFCKNCKRYWTKGGVLRNIPVGGGSRKNSKRSSSTAQAQVSSPAGSSSPPPPTHAQPPIPKSDPYGVLLINDDQPASVHHDRPILDLNGENFSSITGHPDGSTNITDHEQSQSSVQAQGSWYGGPSDGYRPNYWSGGNVWPGNLAMYTPESNNFQQFIEFPYRRTED